MRIKFFYFYLIVNFCLFLPVFAQDISLQEYDTLKKENEDLRNDRDNLLLRIKSSGSLLTQDYDTLKRDYDDVKRDRDNLMLMIQKLRNYKVKLSLKDDAIRGFKQKIIHLNQAKETSLGRVRDLEIKIGVLEKEIGELSYEKESLEKYIEKREIEYKIVDNLKSDSKRFEIELERLKSQRDQLQDKVKKAGSEKTSLKAEVDIFRRQIKSLKKQYTQSLKKNKQFEKKLQKIPKKFTEIARENKVLLKETALMHYNLGVFYIEEGHHLRAIAELKKAVELNPEDAYAYFNLGYIYAEYQVNRPKAIDYFRRYLRLASKEDTEIDWVKRYILTWQAWEGEGALK